MCGRHRLRRAERLAASLDVTFEEFSEVRIIHDFTPTQYIPIVRLEAKKRVLDAAFWGFIPSWASGDAKVKPINAKSETVATSGMFKFAFKNHRCLLPADGFFEPKGPKGMKHRPQFFFQQPDHEVFAFAGVWSYRDDCNTCALLTTTPNVVVGQIHNRMPVILAPSDYQKWLDPKTELEELQQLLRPAPDADLIVEPEKPMAPTQPGLFD